MKRHPSTNIFPIVLILAVVISVFIIMLHRAPTRQLKQPEIAFVIDDWGYNLNNIDSLFQIERPVTLAILPHLRYSEDIARKVEKSGKEYDVILHLPLESKSDKTPEHDTIRRNMKKDRVLAILKDDIEGMPGIIGVSNHQGSRATENKEIMRIILEELKKRGLFFLDSRTTSVSVCGNIAEKIGLKYAERDIFLDLGQKKEEKQYRAYVKIPLRSSVKARPCTRKAISSMIPKNPVQGQSRIYVLGLNPFIQHF